MKFVAVFLIGVFFATTDASARQAQPAAADPVATARLHVGPLGITPRAAVTNVGVDTNVFNSTVNEQSDFTFTVVPGTELFLRTGKGLFTVDGNFEFVYFNEFETERSINSRVAGLYEFRFNRLRPYASASWLDTKERPGYEIDVRARHYEAEYHAGADFRVAPKTTIGLDFRRLEYSFAGDEVFNGQALNEQLNRTLRAVSVSWRQRLTSLTTWETRITREMERFEFEDFRNSDSFRVSSGFDLDRLALIRGRAFVGYRHLKAADGGIIPTFSGVTADVGVSYTAPSQTRLGVDVDRDVQYSYDTLTPYYIQTGWTVALTQRVTGRWDAQVTGGRDRLAYQTVLGLSALNRTDFVGRFGGGIGYTLGDQVRASFDVISFHRSSERPGNEYGAVRAGFSVTYGY